MSLHAQTSRQFNEKWREMLSAGFLLIITLSLSILTIVYFPPGGLLKSITVVALSFLFLSIPFTFSKRTLINKIKLIFDKKKIDYIILVYSIIIIPYIILSLVARTMSFRNLGVFTVFYIIPISFILLNQFLTNSKRLQPFLIVIGALILWIGMDHRYTMILFNGYEDLGYHLTTLWLVQILFLIYTPFNISDFNKVNTKPTISGIQNSLILVSILMVILIPSGLTTGFISWNPDGETSAWLRIATYIVIYLTIALPEEFIFRGIILHEFDKLTLEGSPNRINSLIFVSLLFGLTHWNNVSLAMVPYYVAFATIAGIAYGFVWRRSGLFGAAFLHATVDWVWAFYFK